MLIGWIVSLRSVWETDQSSILIIIPILPPVDKTQGLEPVAQQNCRKKDRKDRYRHVPDISGTAFIRIRPNYPSYIFQWGAKYRGAIQIPPPPPPPPSTQPPKKGRKKERKKQTKKHWKRRKVQMCMFHQLRGSCYIIYTEFITCVCVGGGGGGACLRVRMFSSGSQELLYCNLRHPSAVTALLWYCR